MTEKFVGRINPDTADVIDLLRWLRNNCVSFTIRYDPHQLNHQSIENYLICLEGNDLERVKYLYPAAHLWEIAVDPAGDFGVYIIYEANEWMALVSAVRVVKEYWLARGETLKTLRAAK